MLNTASKFLRASGIYSFEMCRAARRPKRSVWALVERTFGVFIQSVRPRGLREGVALPLRLWDPAPTLFCAPPCLPLPQSAFHPSRTTPPKLGQPGEHGEHGGSPGWPVRLPRVLLRGHQACICARAQVTFPGCHTCALGSLGEKEAACRVRPRLRAPPWLQDHDNFRSTSTIKPRSQGQHLPHRVAARAQVSGERHGAQAGK